MELLAIACLICFGNTDLAGTRDHVTIICPLALNVRVSSTI